MTMTKRMGGYLRRMMLVCSLVLAVCLLSGLGAVKTEAANGYTKLWDSNTGNSVFKSGKYYFKYDPYAGKILMSTKKDSGFRRTPISFDACSNGNQAYYTRNKVLYKYVYSTRKESKIKKLPASGDQGYSISTIYGSQIFLKKSSFDQWTEWTYCYNTKTGKLKMVMSKCSISDRCGKYVVGKNEFRSDVSPYKLTLYKITSSGLKKVKTLSARGFGECFVDGKLYYTHYTDIKMKNAVLYRCKANGSGKKKIAEFKSSSEYSMVTVFNITSKKCSVYKDGKSYEYTFATKKLKPLY